MKIEEIIANLDKPTCHNHEIPIGIIKDAVAQGFNISIADLESKKRDALMALARQVAMYLIRQYTNYSLARTGLELGGRNPATISWGYQKIAGNMNSLSLKHKIENIQKAIEEATLQK